MAEAGGSESPIDSGETVNSGGTVNWGGNVTFAATQTVRPRSLDELQEVVSSASRIRAIGAGHSFTPLADTSGTQVELRAMPPELRIDRDRGVVSVGAGVSYAWLCAELDAAGLALANLPSLSTLSLAGAVSTGTHGSGRGIGGLASQILAIDLVGADGELRHLEGEDPDFPAAVVSLGSLGIVSTLHLAVEPSYRMTQEVRLGLSAEEVCSRLPEILADGYSVSVCTPLCERSANLLIKRRVDHRYPELGLGRAAEAAIHPVEGRDASGCTGQLGRQGPWHLRLPHFLPDAIPGTGAEIQSEYFVAEDQGAEAVACLFKVGRHLRDVLQVAEIRSVAAGEQWLDPAYRRDSVGLHFTWVPDQESAIEGAGRIEHALRSFELRTHWAKVTAMQPGQRMEGYPRAADFVRVRKEWDPLAKFSNSWIDSLLGF